MIQMDSILVIGLPLRVSFPCETISGGLAYWPAAGLVDTEIGCFHLSEVHNAKKDVQPRV